MSSKIQPSTLVGIAVAIIIILVFADVGKSISKFFKYSIFGERDPVDYDDTPVPSVPVSSGFDPRPYSARLREVLLDWIWFGTERCEEYYKFMQLNDAEFVIVCNDYKNTFGSTLRTDMNNTAYSTCVFGSTQYDEEIYRRMDDLGVIG